MPGLRWYTSVVEQFVVRGAYVLAMDPALGDLPDGEVHVRDGAIVAVGRARRRDRVADAG
jgi:cytosine/adenosine deaminase-related metal-dependent hydrolase